MQWVVIYRPETRVANWFPGISRDLFIMADWLHRAT
jgi:hypothetical protein